jgi:hypothetical protein
MQAAAAGVDAASDPMGVGPAGLSAVTRSAQRVTMEG